VKRDAARATPIGAWYKVGTDRCPVSRTGTRVGLRTGERFYTTTGHRCAREEIPLPSGACDAVGSAKLERAHVANLLKGSDKMERAFGIRTPI
jgi:hypothetical protein